ncbi:hypothetical protein CRYUN_Cryun11dG0054100 [Craigia yunnanensis]
MAFQIQQIHGFRLSFNKARYHFPCISSLFSAFPFSTINGFSDSSIKEPSFDQITNQSNVDERRVLSELSDLFHFSFSNTTIPNPYKESYPVKRIESRAVDEFLLPEEKLRGIFLQKLRGKTAIEHALSKVSVELSIDIIAKVVNRGNLGGEAMVLFFNWAIKQPRISRDIHCYYIIIKALGRRKFFKFMIEILHDMVKECIKPDLETLSIVMDSFIRAQRVHKALETFENLEELGLKRDTESLKVHLQCLCRRAHVGAANSLFNAMGGKINFNCVTYNIMISGWSKLGRVSEMERILKALIADGFTPDCSTFSYLIEGLGRAGQIDDAVEIFDHMKEKGCNPDTRVYNAMISNFISIGNFDECMKYYKGLLDSNSDPDLEMQESGHTSDMEVYEHVINGLCNIGHLENAVLVMEEALHKGFCPSRVIYSKLNNKLLASNEVEKAYKLFLKIKDTRRNENAQRYWRANGWHF